MVILLVMELLGMDELGSRPASASDDSVKSQKLRKHFQQHLPIIISKGAVAPSERAGAFRIGEGSNRLPILL